MINDKWRRPYTPWGWPHFHSLRPQKSSQFDKSSFVQVALAWAVPTLFNFVSVYIIKSMKSWIHFRPNSTFHHQYLMYFHHSFPHFHQFHPSLKIGQIALVSMFFSYWDVTTIQHNFNTSSFFKPRFCDHCGKLLVGVMNQVLYIF